MWKVQSQYNTRTWCNSEQKMIDVALKKRGKGEETTSYDVKEDMTERM